MDEIARLALGALLVAAAATKLARPRRAARDVQELGVPGPSALLAAVAEGAIGLALLSGRAPVAAGLSATLLGLCFAAVIARAWAHGLSRLRCGCLGGGHERPAWLLLLRAVGLAALGVVAARPPAPTLTTALLAMVAVLVLCVAALAVAVAALARQVGLLHLRLGPGLPLDVPAEGPPVGEAAPALDGVSATGEALVVFGSDGCPLCRRLEPGLRALAADGVPVRLVDEVREADAVARWNVPGFPFAVHLVGGIVVAKGTVNSLEQVEWLLGAGWERMTRAA
jgi:thiol-disulfide isomerase/thioredoxin